VTLVNNPAHAIRGKYSACMFCKITNIVAYLALLNALEFRCI